jgi:hypothetical protein
MQKKLNSSSDDGDAGNKKHKRGYDGTCGWVWQGLRSEEIWSVEFSGQFWLVRW